MLKLKEGFVMRKVAGETIVLPTGDGLKLNMMINLNSTAEFLWERIAQGTDEESLVAALLDTYDVDEARARQSVQNFVSRLRENDFLQE